MACAIIADRPLSADEPDSDKKGLTNHVIFVRIPSTHGWDEVSDPLSARELPVGVRQWESSPKYLPEWPA
jgi:hypothetical protein